MDKQPVLPIESKTPEVIKAPDIKEDLSKLEQEMDVGTLTSENWNLLDNCDISDLRCFDNGRVLLYYQMLTGEKAQDRLAKAFMRDDKNNELPEEGTEYNPGSIFNIDFSDNADAEKVISLTNLLPTSVRYVKVIDALGNEKLGIRDAGNASGRPSYIDVNGDPIPVFQGYKVEILDPGAPGISSLEEILKNPKKAYESFEKAYPEYAKNVSEDVKKTGLIDIVFAGINYLMGDENAFADLFSKEEEKEQSFANTWITDYYRGEMSPSLGFTEGMKKFSSELDWATQNLSEKYGISMDKRFISAFASIESGWRPLAQNKSGAAGLGQFVPSTWRGAVMPKLRNAGLDKKDDGTIMSNDELFAKRFDAKYALLGIGLYLNAIGGKTAPEFNPYSIYDYYKAYHNGPGHRYMTLLQKERQVRPGSKSDPGSNFRKSMSRIFSKSELADVNLTQFA